MQPRHVAPLAIAVAVALIASVWAPDATLARRGQPIVISHELFINRPVGAVKVCQDEVKPVPISATDRYVYRYGSDPRSTRRTGTRPPLAPVRVRATTQDPSVVTVDPPFLDLTATDFSGVFELTGGDKVGTTEVVLEDTLGLANSPRVITVNTVECAIKISSTSTWWMNFNYALTGYGTMGDTTLRRVRAGVYEATGTMAGSASAVSIGGCVPRYRVGDSTVTISANLTQGIGAQTLKFAVSYTTVLSSIKVTCLVVGGSGSGDGTPQPVTFTVPAFKRAKVPVSKAHPIDAYKGPHRGQTEYIVWTEEVGP